MKKNNINILLHGLILLSVQQIRSQKIRQHQIFKFISEPSKTVMKKRDDISNLNAAKIKQCKDLIKAQK